jgi:hypothetical protein
MRASARSIVRGNGSRAHPAAIAGRLGARPANPAPEPEQQPPVPGTALDLTPGSQGPGEFAAMRAIMMPSTTGGMNLGAGMKTGGSK